MADTTASLKQLGLHHNWEPHRLKNDPETWQRECVRVCMCVCVSLLDFTELHRFVGKGCGALVCLRAKTNPAATLALSGISI